MKTKKTPASPSQLVPSPLVPPLRSLLHTMRCIAQHEDALCTLLHNFQQASADNAALESELRTLLKELPARDFLHDLDTVLHSLPAGK